MNLLMLIQGIFAMESLGTCTASQLRIGMGQFMAPQVLLSGESLAALRTLMPSHAGRIERARVGQEVRGIV